MRPYAHATEPDHSMTPQDGASGDIGVMRKVVAASTWVVHIW